MATRAQQFQTAQRQAGPKKAKAAKKAHHLDPAHTMTRNVTKRGDKKSGAALEDSMSGKPSRRSTRPSANHGRTDTALMRTALAASETPRAQASRASVARKK